jgi:hypothetical protein
MASGIGVPGRACSQNWAAGVLAAGLPSTMAVPLATIIRRNANGCMLQFQYCYVLNVSSSWGEWEEKGRSFALPLIALLLPPNLWYI